MENIEITEDPKINNSALEKNDNSKEDKGFYESKTFNNRIEHWTKEIQMLKKRVYKKTLLAWISIGLAIFFSGVGIIFFDGYTWISLVIIPVGISLGIFMLSKASKFRNAKVQKIVEVIQRDSKNENLETPDVVEALFEKTKGKASREVLRALDPDTFGLLNLRIVRQKLFNEVSNRNIEPMKLSINASSGNINSVTVQGEKDIEKFGSIAIEYMANKGYVEGIAALAMVQMIYTEIAPPAGEIYINAWQDNDTLKKVGLQAHKILSDFDITPEMKSVKEALAKRRTTSIIEQLVLVKQKQISQDDESLSKAIEISSIKIRDEAFIGACIDYIGKRTTDPLKRNKAYSLIAQIPDGKTLPYLMEAFKQTFFFSQGIEAVALLGRESTPKLLEALRKGGGFLRFNAALALGFMNLQMAKTELETVLQTVKFPTERVGICYALVRLGDKDKLKTIVTTLDNSDKDVRHAAAIALEHLSEPIDEKIYLKHFEDDNMLVRLRLTRKLGIQGTTNLSLVDALIERFKDKYKVVRSAAVTSVGKLGAELVYDRMVKLIDNGTFNQRFGALEVLGNLSQPRAIPILANALSKAVNLDEKRIVLSALGSLNAVDSVDQIAQYLDIDKYSQAAFWALLRINLKDKKLILKHLTDRKHIIDKLFLLSINGDQKAINQLKGHISKGEEFGELIHALEYAQILKDPNFEVPLRNLMKFRKPDRFPADRYVSYFALKGLVHIQIGKI